MKLRKIDGKWFEEKDKFTLIPTNLTDEEVKALQVESLKKEIHALASETIIRKYTLLFMEKSYGEPTPKKQEELGLLYEEILRRMM